MVTKIANYVGHGYIRKTKVGVASYLLLGSVLVGGFLSHGVSADEQQPNSTVQPSTGVTPPTNTTTTPNTTVAPNTTTTPKPTESRPGVPKDLDTSVNEDFIKQFPYGERFTDEDGVPATRTKTPDVALRFKPKDYEKTVTRKINYRVERTGATVSRIYQTIRYYGTYEFEKGTPEVLEVAEAEVPVVSEKGTSEGHEVKDFEGGVVPLDPPKLEVPEYKGILSDKGTPGVHYSKDFNGGTVPNEAPMLELLDYKGVVSTKGTPEVLDKSEFTGGVVPMDAPQLDKPELKVPEKPQIASEQPKTPTEGKTTLTPKEPLREQKRASENKPALPNTGTSKTDLAFSSLGALGILGSLGFSKWKKSSDLEK